jgi:hypothetical protein
MIIFVITGLIAALHIPEGTGPVQADFLSRSDAAAVYDIAPARFRPYIIELDVFVSGHPALFLSHSLTCGNAQCMWYVYEAVDSDHYRFVGTIGFHPKGFRWDEQRRLIWAYFRHGGSEGHFEAYHPEHDGFRKVSGTPTLRTTSAEFDAEWLKISAWREAAPPVWTCKWDSLAAGDDEWWDSRQEPGTDPQSLVRNLWSRISKASLMGN